MKEIYEMFCLIIGVFITGLALGMCVTYMIFNFCEKIMNIQLWKPAPTKSKGNE